jgi:hypothetical protein
MKNHTRTNWKDGLDITPEVFIEADNYHIAQRSTVARLNTFRLYGVLPDTVFRKDCQITNDAVFINELCCTAITKGGYMIDFQNDIPGQELSLSEFKVGTYYVVLQVNPFQPNAEYCFKIQKTPQNEGDAIPVLKIYRDTENDCWEIEKNYIPPHISLLTSCELIEQYEKINNELSIVIQKLPADDPILLQMKLLEVEFSNYSMQESPAELVLLLKKIMTLLKLLLDKMKKANEILSTLIEEFMQIPYTHDDVFPILQSGINCLITINQELEKPEEVKEVLDII